METSLVVVRLSMFISLVASSVKFEIVTEPEISGVSE